MPILLLNAGEQGIIKRIAGKPEIKQHLLDLGFMVGDRISIISKLGNNFIVNVKETRIAIDGNLAKNIFV